MSGHTPWSEIRHKADSSHITALRDELERVGASYGRAGPARYIALHDAGHEVWLRGPPASGLHWSGPATEALERLRRIEDGAGPDVVWMTLEQRHPTRPSIIDAMPREGLPTIRIRTLDHNGHPTGEVLLDPDAARQVPGNVEIALENLGTIIDPTGGVPHAGTARIGTEDGWIEIAWTTGGPFT